MDIQAAHLSSSPSALSHLVKHLQGFDGVTFRWKKNLNGLNQTLPRDVGIELLNMFFKPFKGFGPQKNATNPFGRFPTFAQIENLVTRQSVYLVANMIVSNYRL